MSLRKNFETEISQESAEKLENCLFGVLIDKHSLTKVDQALTNVFLDKIKLDGTVFRPKVIQTHR